MAYTIGVLVPVKKPKKYGYSRLFIEERLVAISEEALRHHQHRNEIMWLSMAN